MIFMDPPEHTALRTLVSRAFTPRHVKLLEERIRQFCCRPARPARRPERLRLRAGLRRPAAVARDLDPLGVPPEDQRAAAAQHRPDLPHRARRRHDQRHLVRRPDRADGVPGRPRRTPRRRPAGRPDQRALPGGDHRRGRATRDVSTRKETVDVRQPAVQRRHRDGRPAARQRGGGARRASPTSGPRSWPSPNSSANAVEELLRFEAPSPVQGRWTTTRRRAARRLDTRRLEGAAAHRQRRSRRARVFPTPIDSTFAARCSTTCRSGTASTSASVPPWPAWRVASRWRRRCERFPSWEVDPDHVTRQHTSTVRGYSEVRIRV